MWERVYSGISFRFQRTYEELKPHHAYRTMNEIDRFQRTYEELKPVPGSFAVLREQVFSVPTRN